jgi:hypothetical protein
MSPKNRSSDVEHTPADVALAASINGCYGSSLTAEVWR